MTTKIQLPLLAAKLAANVARERLAPPRVTSLKDVPPSANALTNEWLTAALCRDVPGAVVVDFAVVGGSDGTSSRRALRVDYNSAGQKAALPTRLFTKSASSFQSRLMLVAGGVTESETIFYRDVRPQLDRLRSPRSYYAAFDPKTYRSMVIMDDLSAERWTSPTRCRTPSAAGTPRTWSTRWPTTTLRFGTILAFQASSRGSLPPRSSNNASTTWGS